MSELSDWLERFRRGPNVIADVIEGTSVAELDFKPAPEKWSIRQVLNHVADTEAVAVYRFRSIIAEDNPALAPFNQDRWASRTDSETRDVARALRTLRVLREDNYELLKGLQDQNDAWKRTGQHARLGEMTLLHMLQGFTTHLEKHAEQIRRNHLAFQDVTN